MLIVICMHVGLREKSTFSVAYFLVLMDYAYMYIHLYYSKPYEKANSFSKLCSIGSSII